MMTVLTGPEYDDDGDPSWGVVDESTWSPERLDMDWQREARQLEGPGFRAHTYFLFCINDHEQQSTGW